jgi:NADH-quinone oxidoreductase subunit N
MLILMFSLAGLPPMMGFYAKFSVLHALVNAGHIWLAVTAVMFSLIGAFYYLRVVKLMYFDEPLDSSKIVVNVDMRLALSINGAAVLLLGVIPDRLMDACFNAIIKTLES